VRSQERIQGVNELGKGILILLGGGPFGICAEKGGCFQGEGGGGAMFKNPVQIDDGGPLILRTLLTTKNQMPERALLSKKGGGGGPVAGEDDRFD